MTKDRPVCYVKAADEATRTLMEEEKRTVVTMASTGELVVLADGASPPEGCVSQVVKDGLDVFMTPPAVNYKDELAKLQKDIKPKLKLIKATKQKIGRGLDFDAKALKKMNEKKGKAACEKFGLPVNKALLPKPALHSHQAKH